MTREISADRLTGILMGAACADALGAGYEFGGPLLAIVMALHDDPSAMVETAMRLASMTHADDRSSQSCAVWCLAIRAALHAEDPSDIAGLAASVASDIARYLPAHATFWQQVLNDAFGTSPADQYLHRPSNGSCVTALRAAWAAVTGTPVPVRQPGRHLTLATEAAVRGGGDTDTVACVAGALLGAMWGYSAVPLQWRRRVSSRLGLRDTDLVRLGYAIQGGGVDGSTWPHAPTQAYAGWAGTDALAVHPHDEGVILAGIDAACGRLSIPGTPVDAVISLCRVGTSDLDHLGLHPTDRLEVRLADAGPEANPHLELVMVEAADAVAIYRAEGKRVLLHCVAAQSRTPSVAALYSVRHLGSGPERALAEVCDALPAASPHPALAAVVRSALQ